MTADPACLFCRIVGGEVPAEVVARDDVAVAFRDVTPQAPVHVLVVPVDHWPDAASVAAGDPLLAGRVLALAGRVAGQLGLTGGYRLVANTGADAGQSVGHLHWHLLGGRPLTWPPG